jgi:hypothetical protein
LLAWLNLEKEAQIDDERTHRLAILAFPLMFFADDELFDRFCPPTGELVLLSQWANSYFWQQQS